MIRPSLRGQHRDSHTLLDPRVYTYDGRLLGTLISFDDEQIRVQGRRDAFSLPGILVRERTPATVTLHVDHTTIGRYMGKSRGGHRLLAHTTNVVFHLGLAGMMFFAR